MLHEDALRICKIICLVMIGVITVTLITIGVITLSRKPPVPEVAPLEDEVYDGPVYTPSKISYNRSMFTFNPSTDKNVHEPAVTDLPTLTDVSINSNYSELSQECNAVLFQICRENFTVNINGVSVSSLLPMILANNESGIRADTSITFSALYPSKIITPNSAEDIYNANCLDVLSNKEVFSELAADWWTRDRGPVQMNPSYGIHNDAFYSQMGVSEQEVLKDFEIPSNFTAYTTKEGSIDASKWVAEASGERGDRFNPRDICLRLSSEFNYALSMASETYAVDSSILALAMCSIHHGAGSVWNSAFVDKEIGYWNSGSRAYELACALTSQAGYDLIKECVEKDIDTARSKGANPDAGLSTDKAYRIFLDLQNADIVQGMSYYVGSGKYSKDYLVYPIKSLYDYIQLSLLYNGG